MSCLLEQRYQLGCILVGEGWTTFWPTIWRRLRFEKGLVLAWVKYLLWRFELLGVVTFTRFDWNGISEDSDGGIFIVGWVGDVTVSKLDGCNGLASILEELDCFELGSSPELWSRVPSIFSASSATLSHSSSSPYQSSSSVLSSWLISLASLASLFSFPIPCITWRLASSSLFFPPYSLRKASCCFLLSSPLDTKGVC